MAEKTLKENLGEFILQLTKIITAVFYNSFAWGFILYKTLFWFIYPVFNQSPFITYTQAVGLILFFQIFNSRASQVIKKEYTERGVQLTIAKVILPWIVLGVDYLIYLVIR